MQSNVQGSPSAMQEESSISPRPLKFRIKRPGDTPDVDAEAPSSTSATETNASTLQSNLEDSSQISSNDRLKSPGPKKRNREISQHNSNGDESAGDASNQLVLYDPESARTAQDAIPVPHDDHQAPPIQNSSNRVIPAVGAFTVQCADCFKWRLIPTKEKYEEIREHIMETPFTCKAVREWRPDITCDDPADISQDGSRVWAIDKPSIAQPPPGWERQLRIRGEGGTKFADVYYSAPNGKKLRSKVEIQKFFRENPEYSEGITLSQFSFQIPTPLQENYCRKRQKPSPNPDAASGSRPLEPVEAAPISWILPITGSAEEGSPVVSENGGPCPSHSPLQTSSPPPATSSSPPEGKRSAKPKIHIKPLSSPSPNEQP